MSLFVKLSKLSLKSRQTLQFRLRYESTSTEPALLTSFTNDSEETEEEKEAKIEKLRNKSKLTKHHRNIIHGKPPYSEPLTYYHESVRYQRRIWARYGNQSNVNPGIAWPDKDDLEDAKEYEKVLCPLSIQEMVNIEKNKVKEKEMNIKERYNAISEKIKNNPKLIEEFYAKQKQKELDAQKSKAEKDRLFNEIRQHFGFNIDPRDEKFQEMLEIKKKEEAKKRRQAKKKLQEEKMIKLAVEMGKQEDFTDSEPKAKESGQKGD